MAISTKKGDTGYTDIYQKRVRKTSEVIELLGTIDEAMAFLVMVQAITKLEQIKTIVEDLSEISAIIAGYKNIDILTEERLLFFEAQIEEFGSLSSFSYPYDNYPAAMINYARTIVRRLERVYYSYSEANGFDERIAKYFNRLSDYLFILEFQSFRY